MNSLTAMEKADYRAFPYRSTVSTMTTRFRRSVALVVFDLIAISSGHSLASLAAFGTFFSAQQPFLLGAMLPIYLICANAMGAYSGQSVVQRQDAVLRGAAALLAAIVVTALVVLSFRVYSDAPYRMLASGIGLAGVLLVAFRYMCASRATSGSYSMIELRDGVMVDQTGGAPSFDTSSFFDPADPSPESLDKLATLIGNIDRVVVRCPSKRRRAWIHILQGMNVHCEIVISSMGNTRPLAMGSYMGQPTLVVARGALTVRERLIKRAFDVAFAFSALIALSPVLLLVAFLIKLDSPGPVMFKQSRIGRQNKLFYVHKFRSMYVDRCDAAGSRSTARDDDRITRVGRVIRKLSIDEIPQLIDVLFGKMSIVGPRPHAISSMAEDRLFWEIDNRYWHRHACKPGLTGLAQVRGYRGSTAKIRDLTDRLAADMEYLAHWSFWKDLAIILQTAKVLLHRNAF